MEGAPPSELLQRDHTSALSVLPTSEIIFQTSTGLQKTVFLSHGILASSRMAKLMSSIPLEGFGLGSLTADSESSAALLLTSLADILSLQLLGSAGPFATRIKPNRTTEPWAMIDRSGDLTLVLLSQDEYDMTSSFITDSLMTIPVPSVQRLSVRNHKTLVLSATDVSSVISSIPETMIELNSHSLLSPRFQPTTPAIAFSVLSGLPQEDTREQPAASLMSTDKGWILPKSSVMFVFPLEASISEKVGCVSSSVMQESKKQTSHPNEYQDISISSFNQGLTDLKWQSAGSLSKLHQTCAMGSAADMKLSNEFSDQVLHSKEPSLDEAFWMNSVILTSWYTLMKSTAGTSGHSFVSACETTSLPKFTEASSLYPVERSRNKFATEEYVLTRPLEEPNTEFPCVYLDCAANVLFQTVHLEPSFSTIATSQRSRVYLSRKLTDVEQLPVMHMPQPLGYTSHDPVKEIPLSLIKGTSFAFHLSDTLQEENDSHVVSHSDVSTSHEPSSSEKIRYLYLEHADVSQTGSVAAFLGGHSLSALFVNMTFSSALFDQPLPTQSYFAKISVPQYFLFSGVNWALTVTDGTAQQLLRWSHSTNEHKANSNIPLSQLHSMSVVASAVIPYQLTTSG
ncbi:protein eyes shut homolog isoform X2 [Rhineura floridana]|nr:protein eyes shut homolog isoform X2 [Rhineura floridana]